MKQDCTSLVTLPEGERLFRVFPDHWRGGFYEVHVAPGRADVIGPIFTQGWIERGRRLRALARLRGKPPSSVSV
jgi:hypothetical protein